MIHPKCKEVQDILLSEYPFTIKVEDHSKIYKDLVKYGYSISQIKKGIEMYHFLNQENNEYSRNFIQQRLIRH